MESTVGRGRGRGWTGAPKLNQMIEESKESDVCAAPIGRGRGRGRAVLGDQQSHGSVVEDKKLPGNPLVTPIKAPRPSLNVRVEESGEYLQIERRKPKSTGGYAQQNKIITPRPKCGATTTSKFPNTSPVTGLKLQPSSQLPGVKSSSSVSSSSSKDKPVNISHLLSKYFIASSPSVRLKKLASSEVRILKVLDKSGNLMVAFQDEDSQIRFNYLLKQMASFYPTPEGGTLRMSGQGLENGEIVAATVYACTGEAIIRRVKVQSIVKGENGRFRANALDIDSLCHWNISSAFSLLPPFYRHPSQPIRIKISNYTSMYPKGIFETLFRERHAFLGVMNELGHTIFASMIGRSISISNISAQLEAGVEVLTGEIHVEANLRLETLYMEAFCNYFVPKVPKVGKMYDGVLTDILPNGTIGLCFKKSLFGPIDSLLNGDDMQQLAQNVTDKDRKELKERIAKNNCRMCIATEGGNHRFLRAKIQGFNVDNIRLTFMESGRDTLLTWNNLICSMTNNPKVPPILAVIPPQGVRFQLVGIQSLSRQQCDTIQRKYGNGVKFRVLRDRNVSTNMLEVELFDPSVSSSQSLNSLWLNCV